MQRDLVEQARDGDLDAFTELVKLSAPRLHGVANLVLRDSDLAKDAVQDALVLAWKKIGALQDPDAWDAWTRRTTVRVCQRMSQSDARRRRLEQSVVVDPGSERVADGSTALAEREWIITELGRIEFDQRVVIVLHYYLDLPMREVADTLGIPFGTAASRLHRGLQRMRTAMQDETSPTTDLITERLT